MCKRKEKPNIISSAFWAGPFLRVGSSGPELCPGRGEPQGRWARRAAWGSESADLCLSPAGPDVAAAWWSSPFPSGGCLPSPKSAPAGIEPGPSPPPQTEPSALWSRAAARRRTMVRNGWPSHSNVWFVCELWWGRVVFHRCVLCADEKWQQLVRLLRHSTPCGETFII